MRPAIISRMVKNGKKQHKRELVLQSYNQKKCEHQDSKRRRTP